MNGRTERTEQRHARESASAEYMQEAAWVAVAYLPPTVAEAER